MSDAPKTSSPRTDAVLRALEDVRARLARAQWMRTALLSGSTGVAALLLADALARARDWNAVNARPIALLVMLISALGAFLLMRRRHVPFTPLRAALWVEEQAPTDFALVTWVEQPTARGATLLDARVTEVGEQAIATARLQLAPLTRSRLVGPLLFLAGALMVWWFGSRDSWRVADTESPPARDGVALRRDVPIGPWRVTLIPPAYTGIASRELGDTTAVRALSGTRIEIRASGAAPDSVRVRVVQPLVARDSLVPPSAAPVESNAGMWKTAVVASDAPMEVRADRDRFAKLLLVEGVADSVPRVTLTLPARDSVLRTPTGRVPLSALLHDDIALASASFEVIVSSGEGERFTVRTQRVGARAFRGERESTLRADLDLTALKLAPGDVIHLRAVARDAHPSATREAGASETRSFRVARPSEYDSVAVEPAPPPEVDKSLLSQRMLLVLTERLVAKRRALAELAYSDESHKLARDQARLREAVGDAVFQRLTGEGGGEHSHAPGDGHDHGVEAVGGKLALSGVNAEGVLEEGDDSPVIAINKPLLEAYNAMWDAGRALEQAEPAAAIPYMRIALAAIERARAASRLYLRGRPPTVIVDLAKVRLSGKDTGATNTRDARVPLPPLAAAREARLLAAAALVSRDAAAARDTIALLRLESLTDAPTFADALNALLASFSTARPASANGAAPRDLTDGFLRARRALGGVERVPLTPWSRGTPP